MRVLHTMLVPTTRWSRDAVLRRSYPIEWIAMALLSTVRASMKVQRPYQRHSDDLIRVHNSLHCWKHKRNPTMLQEPTRDAACSLLGLRRKYSPGPRKAMVRSHARHPHLCLKQASLQVRVSYHTTIPTLRCERPQHATCSAAALLASLPAAAPSTARQPARAPGRCERQVRRHGSSGTSTRCACNVPRKHREGLAVRFCYSPSSHQLFHPVPLHARRAARRMLHIPTSCGCRCGVQEAAAARLRRRWAWRQRVAAARRWPRRATRGRLGHRRRRHLTAAPQSDSRCWRARAPWASAPPVATARVRHGQHAPQARAQCHVTRESATWQGVKASVPCCG
jgi:hypothetical protein